MSDTIQRWTVGEATVTSVVEEQTDGIPPELFFPAATADDVKRHDWLRPHFADADGNIGLRVQALVIQIEGRTVVVDPCVGNDRKRSLPFWSDQTWPFMERFAAAGFSPADVDLVVHTHLHTDHVGWGTHLLDDRWVPTFAGARYVYVEDELDRLRNDDDHPDARQVYADSIEPIIQAGLADGVGSDADLGSGLRLESTPGHTRAHASLWLESGGERLLVTGDVIHHPLQLAEPSLSFTADEQPDLARQTRERQLGQAARPDVLTLGTHFPTLPGGRVIKVGDAYRFEPLAALST